MRCQGPGAQWNAPALDDFFKASGLGFSEGVRLGRFNVESSLMISARVRTGRPNGGRGK